jgi:hypothetical protein
MLTTPDPAAFRVISCDRIGPNLYLVTTESQKYGRVTQRVRMFPPEWFERGKRPCSR